jgi:hypothetical protein
MATCKRCIHFDVCSKNEETKYYGKEHSCGNVEELCKFFKSTANEEVRKMYNDVNEVRPTNIPCDEVKSIVEPLSAMMGEADKMANDILIMAYKINQHLFGLLPPVKKDEFNPQCFRDVLGHHNEQLLMICEELAKISELLGV